jgi:hypothetical protein
MLTKIFPKVRLTAVFVALVLASCATFTGTTDNPVERSFTWFSYVAGDDIKAACTATSRDHFRFVYNAVYAKQIRAYELKGIEGGADFEARARNESGNVARFSFSNPLGPWELRRSEMRLTNVQASEIISALNHDATLAPSPAGQQLASNEFYWIIAACSAGSFQMSAFAQNKVDLSGLTFVPELLAYDETDVSFRKPKPVEGFADGAFYIKINSAADGIVRGL